MTNMIEPIRKKIADTNLCLLMVMIADIFFGSLKVKVVKEIKHKP